MPCWLHVVLWELLKLSKWLTRRYFHFSKQYKCRSCANVNIVACSPGNSRTSVSYFTCIRGWWNKTFFLFLFHKEIPTPSSMHTSPFSCVAWPAAVYGWDMATLNQNGVEETARVKIIFRSTKFIAQLWTQSNVEVLDRFFCLVLLFNNCWKVEETWRYWASFPMPQTRWVNFPRPFGQQNLTGLTCCCLSADSAFSWSRR